MFRLRKNKGKFNLVLMSTNSKELVNKNFTVRLSAIAHIKATLKTLKTKVALFQDDTNSRLGSVVYKVALSGKITSTNMKPRK